MRPSTWILLASAALALSGCKRSGAITPDPIPSGREGGDGGLPDASVSVDGGRPTASCELVPAGGWGPQGSVPIRVEVVARGLEVPWALGWLPGGELLFTERPGRVRRMRADGTLEPAPVATVPALNSGEGGLLGLAVAPDFATSRRFFLYVTTDADGRHRNRVERWVLPADGGPARLERVILDDIPSARFHDGGRLRFGPDGFLYVGTGDAGDPERSRDLSTPAGKLLRVTVEGAAPENNPRPGSPVYLSGLRNLQGFDWLADGTLAVADHGPSGELGRRGHDEVSIARAGDDLGWPQQDACSPVEGTVLPLLAFETAAPPGGLAVYTGSSIPAWKGSLLIATLGSRHLHRVELANGALAKHEVYLQDQFGRLREAVMGPDGHLYLTTSNCDGRGRCGSDKESDPEGAALSEPLQVGLDEGNRAVAIVRPADAAPAEAAPAEAAPAEEVIWEAAPLAPAPGRLAGLDALRGIALLGIFVVNIQGMAWPMKAAFLNHYPLESVGDRTANTLVRLLAMGRFYPLYALLFGVGLGFLLRQTSPSNGAPARWPVVRRCLVLLGLGAGHAVLVWSGDILATYGVTGLLLMGMARWPRGAIWGLTFSLWCVVLLMITGSAAVFGLAEALPGMAEFFNGFQEQQAGVLAEEFAAAHAAFGQGTWWEALRYRFHTWGTALFEGLGSLPFVAAMAGVGFVLVRDGALERGLGDPRRWRTTRNWGLVLAVLFALASWALFPATGALAQIDPRMLAAAALQMPAGAAQAVGLLALTVTWPALGTGRVGRALAQAGRLSLSHYLLQSIVMTALFSGWGGGLYGRVGPGALVAMALGFWGLQVAVSGPWLARFRLGPAEWLWRSLALGRPQPFRRSHALTGAE